MDLCFYSCEENFFYSWEESFFYRSVHVFIEFFFICKKKIFYKSVPEQKKCVKKICKKKFFLKCPRMVHANKKKIAIVSKKIYWCKSYLSIFILAFYDR